MIGQRVESRPGVPWGAVLAVAAAVGLFALAAATRSPHPAVAAVLPLAVAAAVLLTRPRSFAADVTETGLELHDPPRSVPYAAIEGLTVAGKPTQARAPLYLFLADEVVAVPPRLTVPTNELFKFLASRLPETGSRDVPARLADYLRQNTDLFGEAKVFSFRARSAPTPRPRARAVAVCLAVTAAGVVWLVLGIALGRDYVPWAVIGGVVAFMFGLFALGFGLEGRGGRIKNWRQSGLVVGPAGLALVQGDLAGELRWDEVRAVEYRHAPRSFRLETSGWGGEAAGPRRGIHVVVEGARIVIADIYDRPLPVIYDRVRAYWRGRDANA